jgi:regulator of sigma E protease
MDIHSLVVTIVSFSVAIGVLVIVHEFGHFAVAKRLGVLVERFSVGFGPVIFARRRGDTEYAVSAVPLGGYVKMLGEEESAEALADPQRAFSTQSVLRRAAIVFAGPAMNLVFAFVVYSALFAAVGVETPSTEPRVGDVMSGMPAAQAGLQAGDRIVAIGDTQITTWEQLSKTIVASKGERLHLTVERGGATFPLETPPQVHRDRNAFGEDAGKAYRIGIEMSVAWLRVGPLEAVTMGAEHTAMASVMVLKGLALMVTGRVSMKDLGGPIAIASAAGKQAKAGARYYLFTLALLSVNLAVLNLLPIPALDGGHLAFFAIEGVLRRPLRARHREIALQVGILLLITLIVFVSYNDIHRLVWG